MSTDRGRPAHRKWIAALRHRIERVIARRRRARLVAALDTVARWYSNARRDAGGWDMHSNGEAFLLRTLSDRGHRVVFDVGAHVGAWTQLALAQFPAAEVHAFEPVPDTFSLLLHNMRLLDGVVHAVPMGLCDRDCTMTMRLDPERSTMATLLPSSLAPSAPSPGGSQRVEVESLMTTGDRYCGDHGVGGIDVLKVDAEGADHLVLAGFADMLEQQSVQLVQFEYGPWAVQTRFMLADHVAMFGSAGYVVGRLFPDGVDFEGIESRFADLRLANYVAIRAQDALLRDRIAVPERQAGRWHRGISRRTR